MDKAERNLFYTSKKVLNFYRKLPSAKYNPQNSIGW